MVNRVLAQFLLATIFVCWYVSSAHAQNLDQRTGELSQQIAKNMETGQKRRIAVLEFTDLQGQITNFGRYLSEELITRLYDSSKFKVVERQLLNKVIAEQKLSLTGVVDPASARKLGSVLGVDAIVSGTIADRGDSLKINARLIDSETGEVFSAAATEISKDKEVMALLGAGASESNSPDVNPARGATHEATSEDFTFTLLGCRRSGQNITCEFSIKNNAAEDRGFILYGSASNGSSRLIDSSGNEIYPSSYRLGGTKTDRRISLTLTLVPQVSTNASLSFIDLNGGVHTIKLLRIAFRREGQPHSLRGSYYDYADFRNIPVQ